MNCGKSESIVTVHSSTTMIHRNFISYPLATGIGTGPQSEQTTARMNVNYSQKFWLSLDKADCLAAIPWCGYVDRNPRRRFSTGPLLKTETSDFGGRFWLSLSLTSTGYRVWKMSYVIGYHVKISTRKFLQALELPLEKLFRK